MNKAIIRFDDIEIIKHKIHCHKNPIFLEDVDIDNILISNKISSSEKNCKCFIVYMVDDYKIEHSV